MITAMVMHNNSRDHRDCDNDDQMRTAMIIKVIITVMRVMITTHRDGNSDCMNKEEEKGGGRKRKH